MKWGKIEHEWIMKSGSEILKFYTKISRCHIIPVGQKGMTPAWQNGSDMGLELYLL